MPRHRTADLRLAPRARCARLDGRTASTLRNGKDGLRLAPLAAEDGGYQNGQRRGTASVQKARAGEAAGTQKRREAEAGGEVAGMVRIE